MKKILVLPLLMMALLMLTACQKTIETDDIDDPVEEAMEQEEEEDDDEDGDEVPEEEVSFDFDKVVEEPGESSAHPATSTPASVAEPVTEAAPEPEPEVATSAVKSFSVTAKQWSFSPSTITVNEGDTVKLSITSTDVDHGFAIAKFGVSTKLVPGKTVQVEFVADKKGTYSFFCNVSCGSGHGSMKGTLIVN